MTDLPIYPDSYLPSAVVEQVLIDEEWTIYFLEDGSIYYGDKGINLIKLIGEKLLLCANTESQEVLDIVHYVVEKINHLEESRLTYLGLAGTAPIHLE